MAELGLDYAGSSPGAAAVKQAGYTFVARYLSRFLPKTIKQPEFDDMTGNGVGVVLVFEDYAAQALQGYAQGVADAQVALQQANALGWPSDRPIHFAVDFDISDAQKPAAGEYMKGVHSVIGVARTGAYGGYWWIKYCSDNGLANVFWQAVAWSGGKIHPSATLFQRLGGVTVNGTACDVNQALKPDYGQWPLERNTMDHAQATAAVQNAYLLQGSQGANQEQLDYHVPRAMADPGYISALEDQLYHSDTWQMMAYKAGHYDADTAAQYAKGVADGKASVPAPDPTPSPSPDPTPPTPAQDWVSKAIKQLKAIFGIK